MANTKPQGYEYERNRANLIFDRLVEITTLLTEYNVRHTCLDGTALGLYRDNDIILGDSDYDIGMRYNRENVTNLLKFAESQDPATFKFDGRHKEISKRMFIPTLEQFKADLLEDYHDQYSLKVHRVENGRRIRPTASGDIFFLYDPETDFENCDLSYFPKDCYVYTFTDGPVKFFSIPKTFIDNTSTLTVKNQEFKVPTDIEGYLRYTYTDTWRTPIRYKKIKYFQPLHVKVPDDVFLNIRVKNCLK